MNQSPEIHASGSPITKLVVLIPGHEPVPSLTFEHVEFHRAGDGYECRFTVAGADVANIRISALTIDNVIAAMAEAARVAWAWRKHDIPIDDHKIKLN